jgi:large subunit ribosomal protein L22
VEVEARARYMRITPRKARLVANTVIGMPVKDALTVLQFTPRAAAKEVAKVVKSAAANASNNFSQDEDELIVKSIQINDGPTIKRGRPRARGMYFSVFKRTCHIVAVVDTEEPEIRTPRRARPEAADAEPEKKPRRSRAAKTEKVEGEEEESKTAKAKAEKAEADEEQSQPVKAAAEEAEAEETKAEAAKVEEAKAQEAEAEKADDEKPDDGKEKS